jgi:hypothetical protein
MWRAKDGVTSIFAEFDGSYSVLCLKKCREIVHSHDYVMLTYDTLMST